MSESRPRLLYVPPGFERQAERLLMDEPCPDCGHVHAGPGVGNRCIEYQCTCGRQWPRMVLYDDTAGAPSEGQQPSGDDDSDPTTQER